MEWILFRSNDMFLNEEKERIDACEGVMKPGKKGRIFSGIATLLVRLLYRGKRSPHKSGNDNKDAWSS
ncbi:hypothetical protein JOD24_000710 [Kroppenstedtia sanguinis]|uniref:Uncharacterized protein n=1 Tax=Kroppenstedtia sanguinis TaxID=1380684 RepID=A0ABW4CB68_9BACL